MSELKLSKLARMVWIAITVGFLVSFLSVVAAIVLAINDSSHETPLGVHFAIWIAGSAVTLVIMLWRSRRKQRVRLKPPST